MENMSASLHTVIRRYALILGVNEIASATAVEMRQRGWTVVLGHDPFPPVIRRKMAFHDVLFGDAVVIDDIGASLAEDAMALLNLIRNGAGVIVTPLQTHDLIALRTPDVLVDARMQKYRTTPDLRHIAPLTIGLGPSFSAGANCDLAVETQPAGSGRLIKRGAPRPPTILRSALAASARKNSSTRPVEDSGTPRSRSAAASSRVLSLDGSTDCRRARRSMELCAD